MFCAQCGKQLGDSSKFCLSCGTKVMASAYETTYLSNTNKNSENSSTDKNKIEKEEKWKLSWKTALFLGFLVTSIKFLFFR